MPAPALLNTRKFGGYGGLESERRIRDLPHTPETGRRQSSPTPVTDQRSWRLSAEQPGLRDEGRAEELAYLGLPCGTSSPASPATANNEECQKRPPKPKQMHRECLRCPQCGPVVHTQSASTDGGLMQHVVQKHGGQVLLADSVALAQSPGLCPLWHYQIAAMSPVQLLRERHSSSRWGHLPGQTTARASGRSGSGTAGGQQLLQSS